MFLPVLHSGQIQVACFLKNSLENILSKLLQNNKSTRNKNIIKYKFPHFINISIPKNECIVIYLNLDKLVFSISHFNLDNFQYIFTLDSNSENVQRRD